MARVFEFDKLNFLTAGMPSTTSAKGSYKEAFEILKSMDLDGMELEFVHGVRMSDTTRQMVNEIRERDSFILTCHCPLLGTTC